MGYFGEGYIMWARYKKSRRWTVGELIEALGKLDPDRPVELEVDFEACAEFEIGTGFLNVVELGNDVEEEGIK